MTTTLKTRCTHCQAGVRIAEESVGKRIRCPSCKQSFEVASVAMAFGSASDAPPPPAAAETLVRQASDTDIDAGDRGPDRPAREPDKALSARLGQLGRFELKELLGQGAFGRVYRAYDPQLDRFVALKVPTFGPDETQKINRFVAEAKAAARLRHPSIVPTYESGQTGGRYYIAAQFVAGQPLSRVVKDSPPTFRQAAQWVRQLADALAYGHGEGIVHRDIKPANVMIDEKGTPQIMDFGLAKRLNEDSSMTTDGSILGTPAYMSPEQARGELAEVGPASDQYSLGVVLYELLTGKKPFEGSPHAVIAKVIGEEPPAMRSLNAEIPRDLAAICQKAMNKDAANRYATTSALADDLERWLRGDATHARPMSSLERTTRWCRKNPLVAGLIGAVVLVTLAGLSGVSLALWQTNQARVLADSNAALAERQRVAADRQRVLATENFQEADRQRKLAQENLAEAEKQRKAAETSQSLAEQRAAEAKAAKEEAEAKAHELATALTKLKAETDARLLAEAAKTTLESSKADLEKTAAKLASENEEVLRANLDTFYRDRLAKADEAIKADDLKKALALLDECPAEARHWEWKYLKAKAKKVPRMQRMSSLVAVPETFRYSATGDWLVLGASTRTSAQSRSVLGAWNATCHSTSLQFADVPVEEGRRRGGHVCAFGGNELLTVNNSGNVERAIPQTWKLTQGGWTLEKEHDYLSGYALDCGQLGGEWVVLTEVTGERDTLTSKIRLQSISKRRPLEFAFGSILNARFDSDMSHLHVIASESYREVRWHRLDLKMWKPTSRTLSPDASSTYARVRELWRFSISQGDHMCAWLHPPPSRYDRRTNRPVTVVHGGERHDALSNLLTADPDAYAVFTGDGKRLLVISATKGLEVFDPVSQHPTRPLLSIPIANSGGSTTAELHSSDERLAVAIGTSVVMFDISGGN